MNAAVGEQRRNVPGVDDRSDAISLSVLRERRPRSIAGGDGIIERRLTVENRGFVSIVAMVETVLGS